jgi:hypothetical protein
LPRKYGGENSRYDPCYDNDQGVELVFESSFTFADGFHVPSKAEQL